MGLNPRFEISEHVLPPLIDLSNDAGGLGTYLCINHSRLVRSGACLVRSGEGSLLFNLSQPGPQFGRVGAGSQCLMQWR
jgi:hypothetical protein